jgi:site-specific recombinase XerD
MATHRNELSLSRRHTKNCKTGKPQFTKTPEPRSKKEAKADDCDCPIVADGYLVFEPKRIQYHSLGTSDWIEANTRKGELLVSGRLRTSEQRDRAGTASTATTVETAVKEYMDSRGPASMAKLDEATLKKYAVLLNQRMIPFCKTHEVESDKYRFIKVFDDYGPCETFVLSWVNLNPHKNRKNLAPVSKPLGDGTKRVEMERLNGFLNYCLKRKWITVNQSKEIKLDLEKPGKKYGLELHEYNDMLLPAAIEWANRRCARRDPRQTVAKLELLRHSGIRVSDCIQVDNSQLQKDVTGKGYVIHIEKMVKTGEPCTVPIHLDVAEQLLDMPFKGSLNGKRYWFWDGCGNPQKSPLTNMCEDLRQIIEFAQTGQTFAHHATPHTLRHTFAIQNLIAGVELRIVAEWLGHTSIRTAERDYSHAIHASSLRSVEQAQHSWANQKARSNHGHIVPG